MKNTKVKMSKTFNEWTEEACKTELVLVAEDGWNARQGEIDELLLVGNNLLDRIQELCRERDGLQKRVDELVNINESLVAYKNQLLEDFEVVMNENKND